MYFQGIHIGVGINSFRTIPEEKKKKSLIKQFRRWQLIVAVFFIANILNN